MIISYSCRFHNKLQNKKEKSIPRTLYAMTSEAQYDGMVRYIDSKKKKKRKEKKKWHASGE